MLFLKNVSVRKYSVNSLTSGPGWNWKTIKANCCNRNYTWTEETGKCLYAEQEKH